MKRISFFSLFSLSVFFSLPLTSGWLERKAEGWAWYEEVEKKEDPESPPESLEKTAFLEVPPLLSAPASVSASQKAANIKKKFRRKACSSSS